VTPWRWSWMGLSSRRVTTGSASGFSSSMLEIPHAARLGVKSLINRRFPIQNDTKDQSAPATRTLPNHAGRLGAYTAFDGQESECRGVRDDESGVGGACLDSHSPEKFCTSYWSARLLVGDPIEHLNHRFFFQCLASQGNGSLQNLVIVS